MKSQNYAGMMAVNYDELYKEKPYTDEARFLHNQIQKTFHSTDVSILEMACGTGTHSLLLSKYGYRILATDRSEEFLSIAREKASTNNIEFAYMDMLNPKEVGTFDVVICLFDSIGYLIENRNIQQLFRYVRSVLNPGGIFIFEYWHASAFLKHYEPFRYKFLESINLHRVSSTSIDYENQLAAVTYKFFQNGSYYEEVHKNRFFLPQEMNLFIESNGFVLCDRFAGYSENKKIDDTTWHIVDTIKVK